MRRFGRWAALCAAGLVLSVASSARAGGGTDNWAYQSWAKFAPGTTNQYDFSMALPTKTQHISMTNKLVTVDADKVTIETTISGMMGGGDHSTSHDYSSKDTATIPDPTGSEDLTIGGKTYSCKVYDLNQDQLKSMGGSASAGRMPPNAQIHVKLWTSADVPGAVVKMHSEATIGQRVIVSEMTMTSFDTK